MILRLTELSVGFFAITSSVSTAFPWQYITPLGIVAFMIVQNIRQQRDLAKLVKGKDEYIQTTMARLIVENTDANNRIAQALEDRPCLAGDQRIKE